MPEWIDITMPFGAPGGTWPGDAPLKVEWTSRLEKPTGDLGVNLSRFCSSPHNGTHSDAPFHVFGDGATSESLPLEPFLGPCVVVDAVDEPGPLVNKSPHDTSPRILFKTRAGPVPQHFPHEFKGLDARLIRTLVANGTRLIGTDAPSVDRGTLESHVAVMRSGGVVLENLDLSSVEAGAYELMALPLRVAGLCAAPVRALVRRLDRPTE